MSLFPRNHMTRRSLLPALSEPEDERAADAEDTRTRPFAAVSALAERINGRDVSHCTVQVFASADARDAHVAALLAEGWKPWLMSTADALAAHGSSI
jgi:hypothetical protein